MYHARLFFLADPPDQVFSSPSSFKNQPLDITSGFDGGLADMASYQAIHNGSL
jgi:hypothetical protein